jgi:hypothetical protein
MRGEAMIPYLARLLDITINNGTLPADWKRATVVKIHKGGDPSLITNYRPVNFGGLQANGTRNSIIFKASLG